jgi:hypothetical protein
LENTPSFPGGGESVDVIWGKKYKNSKKKEERGNKKEERGKKMRKGEVKGSNKCYIRKN